MDINEKNCNDSSTDRSSVADESTSPAETESGKNSTLSPGPSTYDVKRKRRGSNEIFNRRLLKKNVTDLKNLAAGEEPESSGSSNVTVETQNSDSKMEDSGAENKENDSPVEEMDDDLDETVASTSDQVSYHNILQV